MAGKRLLPLLGGSSAVWITCLVFFQSALLLGYLCAHFIATRLPRWPQLLAYGALLALSVAQVAANLNPHPHASTTRPIFSVLWLLTTLIGLPFLTLSATNPLLQSWYAYGPLSEGQDSPKPPYHLFALSNFGSLLALLVYPLLVEPNFSLRTQTLAWSVAFLAFVMVCGVIMAGRRNVPVVGEREQGRAAALSAAAPVAAQTSVAHLPPLVSDVAPSPATRVLWLLMAAGGSLLLSAVTSHLSQNIAAIPLLWILPLTIYLLTFVLAFNGGRFYSRWLMMGLLPSALGGVGYLIFERKEVPIIVSIPLYCLTLFIGAFFCHGELYLRRPAAPYLTQYYLLIAAGGALGSTFVGVLAPLIFNGSYEMAWSLVYTAALAAVLMWRQHWAWRIFWPVAAIILLSVVVQQHRADRDDAIVQVRSFYGTLRVTDEATEGEGRFRTLIHGTIQHGTQFTASEELRRLPTTYYSRNSGVGLALDNCCKGRARRVADIGLGTGTLAAYGEPGDVFRFYEIDPRVEVVARNVFTYLRESKAKIEIAHGDARLSMETEPPENYDVIAVDAFSGDAIPVHLLTAEALKLYQRHLAPGGIIAFHISNTYLKLAPVVQEQADHAGLHAVMISTEDDEDTGAYSSDWVLVTANQKFLELPEIANAGEKIEPKPGLRLWTDDYSSLLPVLNLRPPKKDADESGK